MLKEELIIPKEIKEALIKHSQDHAPIESCGYLSGVDNKVIKFYPMTNVDNSAEHFSFDPKEQFQVVKQARKDGHKLLSVYHSHPASPARLSQEDIKLFNDPEPVYIIVSLKDNTTDIKGFKINKPNKNDIEIKIVDIKYNGGAL